MFLVDEHRIREWPNFLCRLNSFFRQIRLGFLVLQRIDPRACIFGAAGILRYGDDLKILVFQLFVDCLPAWQIKAASSPRGPSHQ
jgi:hypothetical protein